TGKVPISAPSLARIFETVLLPELAIQRNSPSNSKPAGDCPVSNAAACPAAYHRRSAIACRFGPAGPIAPTGPGGPCGPTGPTGPWAPAGPAGPVAPCKPRGPAGPAGPVAPTAPWGPAGP